MVLQLKPKGESTSMILRIQSNASPYPQISSNGFSPFKKCNNEESEQLHIKYNHTQET